MFSSRFLKLVVSILFLNSLILRIESLTSCYNGLSVNSTLSAGLQSQSCPKTYCKKVTTSNTTGIFAFHSCEDSCTYSVSGSVTTTCCITDNCNAPNTTGILQCYSTRDSVNNQLGEKLTCSAEDKYCKKAGAGTLGINTFKKSCEKSCTETSVAGSGVYCCATDFCNSSVTNIGSKFIATISFLIAFIFM